MSGSVYAVLIAVERYQQPNIPGVSYAVADAEAMQDMLIKQMRVPPQNIKLWKNEDVTRTTFEQNLKYEIDTLAPDDQFIFFYAGHGFYADGSNRLSMWETHSVNLESTTVCLEKVLLSPLRKGFSKKSLVFIDACASTFLVPGARRMLQDMKPEEFEEFVKSTEYCGAFFSCTPGQQSHSLDKLKHGIWTHHLLKAFRGEDSAAFERDRTITGQSLQNYLKQRVPDFIARETTIKESQRPYAVLAANGTFKILNVPDSTSESKQSENGPLILDQVQTMPDPQPTEPIPIPVDTAKVAADQQLYWKQRRQLVDTPLMTKIFGLPRWRLWSRPLEFRKARFQSLDHCTQFVLNNWVHSSGRLDKYPRFELPLEDGFESIAAETDSANISVEHTERWVLFKSGQFVHNMALDRVAPLGDAIHVFEVLEVITALYEFSARMADTRAFTNDIGIAVDLQNVDGRKLIWPGKVEIKGWCQDESISIDSFYSAQQLQTGRRTLALDVALKVYAKFGWESAPKDELADEQRDRFGSA